MNINHQPLLLAMAISLIVTGCNSEKVDKGISVDPCTTSESQGDIDLNAPATIMMGLFENCEMLVGQARLIELRLLPDESIESPSDDSAVLQEQDVSWVSSDPEIVDVDPFGRVEAKKVGKATISAFSTVNTGVKAHAHLEVKSSATTLTTSGMRIVGANPLNMPVIQQKVVERFSSTDALTAPVSPSAKAALAADNTVVETEFVKWELINNSGIGSKLPYVLRTDKTINNPEPYSKAYFDKYQYLMGSRYLPMDVTISKLGEASDPQAAFDNNGTVDTPLAIADDEGNGIWIKGSNGSLSHVYFEKISGDEKADLLSKVTQTNIARRGQILAGGVTRDPGSSPAWTGHYADSDPIFKAHVGTV
ncbi:Ig-like domain-containing protein [Photobacterium sp. DNB23_23_1]